MKSRLHFTWLDLLEGILLILLGGYTLIRPASAITGIVMLYGAMAVITGVADIMLYIRVERFTGFGPVLALITGTLSVMAGLMLLVYPTAGTIAMTVLFPIWFIAHCVSRLANLNTIRVFSGEFTYYFTLILNILGLILGMLMLIDPLVSLMSIRFIISFYLLLLGVDCVILAIRQINAYK